MKAIVNTAPGKLEWRDWPTPEPEPGQVRIRTAACGICATDLEMIKGWNRTGFPSIPGHEWSGVVDKVGRGGDAALVGQPCVGDNFLSDGGEVGFEHPGGYAEFLITEAKNLHVLPSGFPLRDAALIEPLAVCVRGMRRWHIDNGGSALILGDGPIGLILLLLLKRNRTRGVVLVGGRRRRLAVARDLGADQTVNYHDCPDLVEHLSGLKAAPYQYVVEATGTCSGMRTAIEAVARAGRILVIGNYGDGRADFRWNDLLIRELELIGSCASAGAWPEAVRLAVSQEVPLERLVSHCFPARAFAEAFQLMKGSRDIVKAVLEWTS